ncbi:hypothetical protein EUX98_g5597 [Antrodiella citrinella]|uniref:Uncharacterized protein n=1 Tax=Antrodiella citrinella TaxID=2447956 RepID=A0A4V3XID0_9APHY|nr:hypothetical protein EUX98_g5597 [Antrodiella citrinella]
MPHTTHIALDVLNDHDQDEVDPEPINASIQRYLHLTSAHLHVFHDITNVEFQNVDGFYVRGWNTTTLNVGEQDPPTSSGISSAPIFQFALPDEDGENIEITSSVLVLFMESFPFSPVLRTLCLSLSFDDFEISAAEWAKLFDVLHVKAPSLRQLTIKANLRRDWALEHSTTQAATIIQVIVDVLQMLSDERQPLPLLQKINVHDVPDSIRDVLEIITAIDNCAQSRRHHGPLHVVINGFESQLPLYEYEVKPTS